MTIDNDLEAFFDAYGAALSSFDAERAAAQWGTPGTLLSDGFAGSLSSTAEMAQGLAQSYPFYRRLGLARVSHTVIELAELTGRIIRIRVRWHFYDESGELLTDSDYEYLLRRDDDGLRAYVAVAIDEQEKLAKLAAAKGIDLSAR